MTLSPNPRSYIYLSFSPETPLRPPPSAQGPLSTHRPPSDVAKPRASPAPTSPRSHLPCPASSRCWAAQGAVRGRHLPPACPVGAAPRRPWSGGPGSAAAGDGGSLRPYHRPERESGAPQAPELQQARRTRRLGGGQERELRVGGGLSGPPAAATTGTGTRLGRHHRAPRRGEARTGHDSTRTSPSGRDCLLPH